MTYVHANKAYQLFLQIVDILMDAHAMDICVIDVTDSARFTDYFILANGRSERHLRALAGAVLQEVRDRTQTKRLGRKIFQ